MFTICLKKSHIHLIGYGHQTVSCLYTVRGRHVVSRSAK